MKNVYYLVLVVAMTLAHSAMAAGKGAKSAGKKEVKAEKAVAPNVPFIKMDGADGKDIVEVAAGSKDHTSLVAAVKAAELVETLTGPGPYTIFAPTDAAFAKVPKATVESLFKPEHKSDLKALLEHHAAAPAYKVEVLASLTDLDVVDGPKLKVSNKNGKLFVDDIEIKAAIAAKNGIIYVIDSVLIPKTN
jgi:uncharacterized surface protein with fasciclin (FAS1) repeats